MRNEQRWWLVGALAMGMVVAQPALAGLFDDDVARQQVADLRKEHEALLPKVTDLLDRLGKLEVQVRNQKLVELLAQLDAANAEIAKLRGQLEVVNYNLESAQKRQKDLYIDLDTRLQRFEDAANASQPAAGALVPAAVPGTPPVPAPPTPPAIPEAASPDMAAYDAVMAVYRAGNYAAAIGGFQSFLATYPKSKLAPNAQYWTAMSYADQRQCKEAVPLFRQLVATWPTDPKAADGLRSQANCLLELGDKAGARKSLQDVITKYPLSDAAQQAKRQLGTLN
jgi:tol-pal system protein YbgF